MANVQYLDINGLRTYDGLIKNVITTGDSTVEENSKVYLVRDTTNTAYAAQYHLFQGGTTPAAGEDYAQDGTQIGTINIPLDYVINSANVRTCSTADQPVEGLVVGDKYIDLEVNVKSGTAASTHLYIAIKDMVTAYSVQRNAVQVQLAISAGNEISATIVAGSIGTTELANDAVTTAKILDDAVTTAKILDDAVTTDKIVDDAVTTAKVVDANITAAKLASDSVTTAKILDANVTTAKIADANVTAGKLASDSVTTAKIVDENVTADKLAANAVTTAKITDANVTTAKIADANVTTAKIANENVTLGKLETSVQTSLGLADTAVQPEDIEVIPTASIQALFSA